MVMEPGAWYGRKDIMAMTGLGRGSAAGVMDRLRKSGLLERVNNPDYRGIVPPQRAAEEAEPLYLYRLSELGARRQAEEMERQRGEHAACGGS
jgi:predicted transcriptional regulator of viral defense system